MVCTCRYDGYTSVLGVRLLLRSDRFVHEPTGEILHWFKHKWSKDFFEKIKQIHCKFIRIDEGESCGRAIARIAKELYKSA